MPLDEVGAARESLVNASSWSITSECPCLPRGSRC